MVVQGDSGTPYVIDARYYYGRWNDDYIPTALARSWGTRVTRPALAFEGGNLLSDGQGKCVTTDRVVRNNAADFGYSTQDVATILRDYYGCSTTVRAAAGEGAKAIDITRARHGPSAALGTYDPSLDSTNAAVLDEAARLRAAGFAVTRLPMPSNDGWACSDRIPTPSRSTAPCSCPCTPRTLARTSAAPVPKAYPGRSIVPLDSTLIAMGGAIHCVTMIAEPFSG